MKSTILSLAALAICLSFTACSKNVKRDGTAGDGTYSSGAGTDGLYNQSLPGRIDGSNPELANYDTLQAYVVLFDFNSFSINAAERSKLNAIAKWMTENSSAKIVLAGHTDARGTTQYNVGLGERRALATRDYLLGLGADGSRLMTITYGEERPAVAEESEAAYSQNRRCAAGILP